jgi:putative tryptophan/tyrosine transport system substrate-binding protein
MTPAPPKSGSVLRRREFIGLAAGATLGAILPRVSRAQQQPRAGVRRLGALTVTAPHDSVSTGRAAVLKQSLAALDWQEGANLRIDWHDGDGDIALIERAADELIASAPDVLLAVGTPCVTALRQRTSTIPIVFAVVTDPIDQGFIAGLAHPGGNVTGFTDYDGPMAGKWLEMLMQITPRAAQVAVLYNPSTAPFAEIMMRTLQAATPSLAVTVRTVPLLDAAGIAPAITALSAEKNMALLVLPDFFTMTNRASILTSAAQASVPAVYWNRAFVADGGLMSYGTDNSDIIRRAAGYIDRILRGEKPADLPVQNPTKFELAINLKTAKAIGVTFSPALLATADEVIE